MTIPNSNPRAIRAAAVSAFAIDGYRLVVDDSPRSLSFDRPLTPAEEVLFGSHTRSTTIRVRVDLVPVPQTTDFRLIPQVSRTASTRAAQRETPMLTGRWATQIRPILLEVRRMAANAGRR